MTPSLAKEVVGTAPALPTSTLRLQAFSDFGSAIAGLDHALEEVGRARECPHVRKCTRLVPARRRRGVWADNKMAHVQGFLEAL